MLEDETCIYEHPEGLVLLAGLPLPGFLLVFGLFFPSLDRLAEI